MNQNKLKWIGFLMGLIIFAFMLFYMEKVVNFDYYFSQLSSLEVWSGLLIAVIIFVLPSIIGSILSLFKKFNWLYLIGGIYSIFGIGIIMDSTTGIKPLIGILFLILPGLILFFIPIINKSS